ncbi:DEAD/DEAH box helicase family protein [Vibrio sp. S4M6]|uniref:DEAD/DEAH box helicase family protein n=1 Tax=Vibrio sinus TaxID=2946865 RepID=UPI00202A6D3B|nr:DEAD/DEAH box helicase family protein [Vibrio sinus]MCL9779897.1 DEAD/DEAH box helicase family protein [Vibrio sinus]
MPNLSLVLDHDVLTIGNDDPLLDQLLHAINHATEIEIAVSFIQPSGLDLILPAIIEALERQELVGYPLKLRILTSDYLHITNPIALRSLVELNGPHVEVKIFEAKNQSFHMKSYIFVRTDKDGTFYQGSVFIGSNNISKSALTDAHEWCLRYDYQEPDTSKEAKQFHIIREKFNEIFNHSSAAQLTDSWIAQYIKIRQPPKLVAVGDNSIVDGEPFTPNSVQDEALSLLNQTRSKGYQRGLVVLGTGMGKTWLSAFDAKQMNANRVLFVAHREEILTQAFNTYAKLWPEKTSGYYHGKAKEQQKDMLFASVQTLGRETHFNRFDQAHFDYIVVDEFHHASAKTYRNVIDYFTPKFLLGLTATPERTDQANILSLCHDNLVFERNLVHGIDSKILVPFHYFGVWDEYVNYEEIPWRNGKFDPTALDAQFATQKRAEHIFKHWQKHQQSRTLAFCISQNHADYMAEAFNRTYKEQGLKAVSVHSNSQIRRNEALNQLDKGEIQVIFSIDLFNEGTDLPSIDTVLMIRPTESNIIFLQQLGRGLRLHKNKTHLVVLDFIGNHKSFLNKQEVVGVQLESISEADSTQQVSPPKLGDGCYVNIDPKVTDFWQRLVKEYRSTALEDFLNLEAHLGHRPSATEFYRSNSQDISKTGHKVNKQNDSWFQLVASQVDNPLLKETIFAYKEFLFKGIQTTSMVKSFKAILLEAFLELDGFRRPPTIEELAEKSWHVLSAYPYLKSTELPTKEQSLTATDRKWATYWRGNPIKAFTTTNKNSTSTWFVLEDGRFKTNFELDDDHIEVLHDLVKELVDFRLAQYTDRKQNAQSPNRPENPPIDSTQSTGDNVVQLPYYPDLKIACGHFKTGHHDNCEMMDVGLRNVDPNKHFLASASGNSMNGGKNPIHDGDILLLEAVTPTSAGSITGNTMAIEMQDESGDNQYLLRVVEKRDGQYWLKARNPDYETIPANDSMRTFARLKQVLKTQ